VFRQEIIEKLAVGVALHPLAYPHRIRLHGDDACCEQRRIESVNEHVLRSRFHESRFNALLQQLLDPATECSPVSGRYRHNTPRPREVNGVR
jgi:hypothetical protein